MRDGAAGRAVDADEAFRHAVQDIFGPRCKAAWLSGSYVYEGAIKGRSDIDVVLVLADDQPLPADPLTLERIHAFIDAYLQIHARIGLDPDLDFPGEYVVPGALEEAIGWRGVVVDGKVADFFPPIEEKDYWISRPDRWFHAWVSMTAFSRFLIGDESFYQRTKIDAWKCILRFLLLRSTAQTLRRDDLWPGLAQFGAKPTYRAFWSIEGATVDHALAELEKEGDLALVGGRIRPDRSRLDEWEDRLNDRVTPGDEARSPLVLPPDLHRDIGQYAARRWPGIRSAPSAIPRLGEISQSSAN